MSRTEKGSEERGVGIERGIRRKWRRRRIVKMIDKNKKGETRERKRERERWE
jgi:hypothetical protein